VHLVLGIVVFIRRRSLKIGTHEWVQLGFGLLIPLFLMRHVTGTRGAHEYAGVDDNYAYALWVMWSDEAWRQAALMTLVWVHGLIGPASLAGVQALVSPSAVAVGDDRDTYSGARLCGFRLGGARHPLRDGFPAADDE
jgi:hypothetical protein